MTAHTMTFHPASPIDALIARVAGWTVRTATNVATWLNADPQREPRTPEELIAWAEQYESTQPSYAADLRAIAKRHMD
ncbi:hypothetical protein [Sphaerotilus mobilis]|uniref:Uncharacterized protein n=1 Tax=Sphaerotilus mobilis TaxID=47994 RepID=A0A4Q7LL96_9BURK|nr:hypothetical protein [Sphaerotilus mobilis]RZS54647.1 hypothetical protein EV685_2129 [Sphaerotilus mobilis]